ncbi:MAG: right-handed parallel beta-helix repeat-containing protein [Planctomycetes bacterium]|nr:right-handed parallel beta-helix repeat-containing protein [Planctomycetota bacterium]
MLKLFSFVTRPRVAAATLVLALLVSASANAQDLTTFNNNGGDGLWGNPANWSTGVPDAAADKAFIGASGVNALIDGSTPAGNLSFDALWVGLSGFGDGEGQVLMSGGTLNLNNGQSTNSLNIGEDGNDSTFALTGGTVNVGFNTTIARNVSSATPTGTLDVSGGTLNTFALHIPSNAAGSGANGFVSLTGGEINVSGFGGQFSMRGNSGTVGNLEIGGTGVLNLAGNQSAKITDYLNDGWIYTNDVGKQLNLFYNSGTDTTTVNVGDIPTIPPGFSVLFTDSGPPPETVLSNSNTGVFGGEFVTGSQSTEVTQLGFFDAFGDGLQVSHEVVLWDVRTETMVAQVTLAAGIGDDLIGEYRYSELTTPVVLPADTEYRLVVTTTAADGDPIKEARFDSAFPNLTSLPTLDPTFSEYTFGVGRFLAGGTSSDFPPTDPSTSANTQGVPSTLFGPVSFIGRIPAPASAASGVVPEPSSGLLFASALAIAGLWSRRNRSARDARIGTLGATLVVALLISPTANAAHPSGTPVPAGFTDVGFAFTAGDSTAGLQTALDDLTAAGDKIFVPKMASNWIVEPLFLNRDNQDIIFEDGVVLEAKAGSFQDVNDRLLNADFRANVRVEGYGATFRMRQADYTGGGYAAGEWRHGISLRSVQDFEIAGLTIEDTGGDGILLDAMTAIGFNKNVIIEDVTINNAYRNGISVISAQDLLIDNAIILNTVGTNPRAGIDFEPDTRTQRIVNATVRNSVIVANGNDGIIWGVTEGFQAKPVSGLIENVTVFGNSRFGFALDGNGSLPGGGALPFFEIKDSLVVNNSSGGFRVVAGSGTQTIEYSAFSGNTGSGALVGAAAFGTGTITGTAPVFVNTSDPTNPLYFYLDPSTSTLISLGDSDGSFIGARGVAGDFDADADITGFDFLAWQRGESPNAGSADDLAAWEMFFGEVGAPALAAGAGAVPEPSTAVLAGIVGLLLVGRSRRNRERVMVLAYDG